MIDFFNSCLSYFFKTERKALRLIGAFFLLSAGIMTANADQFVEQNLRAAGIEFERQELTVEDAGQKTIFTLKSNGQSSVEVSLNDLSDTVRDDYAYSGLAVYLGMAPAITVSDNKVSYIKTDDTIDIGAEDWTGFKGRFETVLIQAPQGTIGIDKTGLTLLWENGNLPQFEVIRGHLDTTQNLEQEFGLDIRRLQYSHLWYPLAVLCRWVESLFKIIQSVTGWGWGVSLVLFALVMKILMLPFSALTKKFQNQADIHKTALEPVFAEIKQNYKGETAHKKTMAAYKARGITPYYILKPLLVTLLSIPVLIAVFNMLGEVDVFRSTPFLWADSLAYPDSIAKLPFKVGLLGGDLNIMPFLMAAVTIISTFLMKNPEASEAVVRGQRRNLYLMTIIFFVLFYPFPVAMVFYWTLYNAIQLGISQFSKLRRQRL